MQVEELIHVLLIAGKVYLPLLSHVLEETLLVLFDIFSQTEFQLYFGYLDPLLALPGHLPIIFPVCVPLPPVPMHFAFVF